MQDVFSLKHFFRYLIKKWKLIVCIVLLCLVAAGALYGVQSKQGSIGVTETKSAETQDTDSYYLYYIGINLSVPEGLDETGLLYELDVRIPAILQVMTAPDISSMTLKQLETKPIIFSKRILGISDYPSYSDKILLSITAKGTDNGITIKVESASAESAELYAKTYLENALKQAEDLYGPFDYVQYMDSLVKESSDEYIPGDADSGASQKTENRSLATYLTLFGIAGFAGICILLLLWYLSVDTIKSASITQKYNINLLGALNGKKSEASLETSLRGMLASQGTKSVLLSSTLPSVNTVAMLTKLTIQNMAVLNLNPRLSAEGVDRFAFYEDLSQTSHEFINSNDLKAHMEKLNSQYDCVMICFNRTAYGNDLKLLSSVSDGMILVERVDRSRQKNLENMLLDAEAYGTPVLGLILEN